MSNPTTFINDYSNNIVQLVKTLKALETQNNMIDSDSTLLDRYFAGTPTSPFGSPRADIVKADVTAAHGAMVQLLFAFNSGAPTQASALYKMLP